jgi:hypothetical protein
MEHEFTLPARVTEIVRGQDGHRSEGSPPDTRQTTVPERPPQRPPDTAPRPSR